MGHLSTIDSDQRLLHLVVKWGRDENGQRGLIKAPCTLPSETGVVAWASLMGDLRSCLLQLHQLPLDLVQLSLNPQDRLLSFLDLVLHDEWRELPASVKGGLKVKPS